MESALHISNVKLGGPASGSVGAVMGRAIKWPGGRREAQHIRLLGGLVSQRPPFDCSEQAKQSF
jgi:hypothetical protein